MAFNQSNIYPFNMNQQIPNSAQLDYRPYTFEKMSSPVGMAYNLSTLENINTVAAPRGSEQQIFFVNNDEKIYTRQFDNSIGIVGYRQSYVEKIENELKEAQAQLHEIFESISNSESEPTEEETNSYDARLQHLEDAVKELFEKINERGEKNNEFRKYDKTMATISEMA